jgi:16S rRNA (cytidine1402-2'-O)-methyltransferase
MTGNVYLIPVTLGGEEFMDVLPEKAVSTAKRLRYFIVEDIRSARRFLRLIDRNFPIDETQFFELNEHTVEADITDYLDPVLNGNDIGVMSEAGLPGIADPGALIVSMAHRKKIRVIPLSGPSSIILALVSSGLGGQNFTFNGYLPIKPAERAAKIRELEKKARDGFTQIFMETPYRNLKMLDTIIQICNNDTLLCIASDLTLPSEYIRTMKISEWRKEKPSIENRPAVFVLK